MAAVSDIKFTDAGHVTDPGAVASSLEQPGADIPAVLVGPAEFGVERIEDRAVAGENAEVDLAMNVAIRERDARGDEMLLVDPVPGATWRLAAATPAPTPMSCRSRA